MSTNPTLPLFPEPIDPSNGDPRVSRDTARGWRGTHRSLAEAGFFPVAACSLLAVTTLFARWHWTGIPAFLFLLWNLFLAWVPWGLALPFAFSRRRTWWSAPCFVAWLLCLPNAPYIVTDFVHLQQRHGAPLWFDLTLLFMFAWTGCLLGFLSMRVMHAWVEAIWGRLVGWCFVVATAFLTGFGIYLGRFRRWNSWDLLTQPESLLHDTWRQLVHPSLFPRTWGVTILFGAFFLSAYWAIASVREARPPVRKL